MRVSRVMVCLIPFSSMFAAYATVPTSGTDPAEFTQVFEVSPSLGGGEQLINRPFGEVDNQGVILVRFDESAMAEPFIVSRSPDGTTITSIAVIVIVEAFGVNGEARTPLDLQPLRQPVAGVTDDTPTDGGATNNSPEDEESSRARAAVQEEAAATAGDASRFRLNTSTVLEEQEREITRLRTLLTPGTPATYDQTQIGTRVIPDQRIDFGSLDISDYERIKVRVTNTVTSDVYEIDLIPRPFGTRITIGASLMFINRIGVDGGTEDVEPDISITDVNFAAAPGVTISAEYYDRYTPGFLGDALQFLHPGIGINASYLSWNDGGVASNIEIGLGVHGSLFDDTIYATYGWNLQAPAYKNYFGVGVNFVNLLQLFDQ